MFLMFLSSLFSKRSHIREMNYGDKRTVIYLQNSGEWNGTDFSSLILSCKGDPDANADLFTQASNFVHTYYPNFPIRWKDVLNRRILGPENSDGDLIGNKIRDKCSLIDDVHFHGGHIYGGKTGSRYIEIPKFKENHLPMNDSKKNNIMMNICAFEDKHHCHLEFRKGSINDIRQYQDIILNMIVKREKYEWDQSPSSHKYPIITELYEIMEKIKPK